MFSRQFLSMVSTLGLVGGALLVGDAFHKTVVTGQFSLSSPQFVIPFLFGLVLIWVGYIFRKHHQQLIESYFAGRESAATSKEREFDQSMSPLDDESIENLDSQERSKE